MKITAPTQILLLSLFTFHLSPFTTLAALPQVRSEPCPACRGKRSVSLTPPNLGQFDGELDSAKLKAFATDALQRA